MTRPSFVLITGPFTRPQIALGTVILLIGVLALSWRLNNDPATRPSVSQNTLTPGMGFVDDDSDSDAEVNIPKSQADEEANLANGKESPYRNHPNTDRVSSPNDPRTPISKNNDLLSITRLRRKGVTESEEIWEELEDETPTELPPFLPRRSSARSSKVPSRANPIDDRLDEATALLARTGTGRSYRDRRRRRSALIPETQRWERRSMSSQEASGGWWKMKIWWRGQERKNKGKGAGNGHGNVTGESVGRA